MPIDADVGPGGVNVSYGRRVPVQKFDVEKTYEVPYIDDEDNLVRPDGEPISGISNATKINGMAVVDIDGEDYGLMKLDENGDFRANIGHRTAPRNDLMALDGVVAEVSVASDKRALIIHNGEPGEAWELVPVQSEATLGLNSLAVGFGSETLSTAIKASALGPGASADTMGQVVFGSATSNVRNYILTLSADTSGNVPTYLSADGAVIGSDNTPRLLQDGIYDVTAVVLARQPTTNNWARFERRVVFRKTGATVADLSASTPISDANTTLPGTTVSLSNLAGIAIGVQVTGITATPIVWGAVLNINHLKVT